MIDYRIKTFSAALACSTCLMLPLSAAAKDNEKNNNHPAPAHSTPQQHSESRNAGGGHPGGGNPGGHPGGGQLNPHAPNTGGGAHPGGNPPGNSAHGPNNMAAHGPGNTHAPGGQNGNMQHGQEHGLAGNGNPHAGGMGNNLVRPAGGPAGHPGGNPAGNANGHGPGGNSLGHNESQAKLNEFNASRNGRQGVNGHPLPHGEMNAHGNGYNLKTAHGNELGLRHDGSIASFNGHGQTARFGANGHVTAFHSANMDIHNVRGARFITTSRPDHSLLVGYGRHGGYLERPYMHGGHAFLERSYAWGGHFYNRYFYPYRWHGLLFAGAIAAYYYAPHFYSWAYNPWAAPSVYRWGWMGSPWYAYNSSYFVPSVSYADSSEWLTDYSLSQNLSSSYDDEFGDAPPPANGGPVQMGAVFSDGPSEGYLAATAPTPITPALKSAIAQEVREQLNEEKAAAADPNAVSQAPQLQNAMQTGHVFVVSSALNANTPDQQTCALTPGDTLQLQNPPGENDSTAVLRVSSTKKGDCPANTNVQLTLQNLADMQNDLRMQIDSGLATLQENQGKDGLPPAPADALAKPQPAVANNETSGASDVQALLDAQRKQADQAETEVSQSAQSG